MSGRVALSWHDRFLGRGFVPRRASWSRYALALARFEEEGFFRQGLVPMIAPVASTAELLTVHTPAYLAMLEEYDDRGSGLVDGRQTPAYTGMLHRASLAVGGTVLATRLVLDGRAAHVFNPAGGLHHAHPDRASGFCLLNDIAIAIRDARTRGVGRVAVLDLDAHHGDGTQAIFYEEDVLHVSIHEYGGRFFPGTGGAGEAGSGPGEGFTLNLPLPRGSGDDAFAAAVATALARIRAYRPELLIVQFGTDGHVGDPYAHLQLSDDAYLDVVDRVHALAHECCDGRLVLLGGGGYVPQTVARVWTRSLSRLGGFRMLAKA